MIATRSPRRTSSDTFVEHLLVAVRLADAGQLQHLAAARPLGHELELRRAPRAVRQLLDLDLLDLLEAALRLGGLGGLGAEALDEGALAGDLLLGARHDGLLPRAGRLLLDHGLE